MPNVICFFKLRLIEIHILQRATASMVVFDKHGGCGYLCPKRREVTPDSDPERQISKQSWSAVKIQVKWRRC